MPSLYGSRPTQSHSMVQERAKKRRTTITEEEDYDEPKKEEPGIFG